jgi:hypothetical protein
VAKLLARLDDRKVGDVVVLSVERAGKSREVRGAATRELIELNLWIRR